MFKNVPCRLWILLIVAMLTCAGTPMLADETSEDTATGSPRLDVGGIDQPGATIKGIVKFEGKKRKPKSLNKLLGADAVCARFHEGKTLRAETYVFGENDTLRNVLVRVSKGLEGKSFEAKGQRVIDQKGCSYFPHVQAVMVGQDLEIRSSDPTMHNIKMTSKHNGNFNLGIPAGASPSIKSFKKPEIGTLKLKCDIHPWMAAHLHVLDHPFYAITQADGTFEIKGLPAGNYQVKVWHEFPKFKPVEETLEVSLEDGQTKELPPFVYRPPSREKK